MRWFCCIQCLPWKLSVYHLFYTSYFVGWLDEWISNIGPLHYIHHYRSSGCLPSCSPAWAASGSSPTFPSWSSSPSSSLSQGQHCIEILHKNASLASFLPISLGLSGLFQLPGGQTNFWVRFLHIPHKAELRQIITSICHQVESGAHLPPGGCGRSKGGDIVTSGQVSRSLLFVFLASQETNKMTGTWRNTAKLSRHTPQRISHLEFCNFSKYSIREMFKVKVLLWFECCIKMKRLFQSRFRFENVKVKHLNVLIYVCGQELTFCIKFNKIIRLKIVNFGSGNCFEIFMSPSGQLVWNKVGKLSSKMTYK